MTNPRYYEVRAGAHDQTRNYSWGTATAALYRQVQRHSQADAAHTEVWQSVFARAGFVQQNVMWELERSCKA